MNPKENIEKLLAGMERQLELTPDKEIARRLRLFIRDIKNELEFLS